jgi:hypothetical protein
MNEWLDKLRPHKTVPNTPWTAEHRWDFGFQRFSILAFGLFIFGLGDSLLIISGLGNAPWSVLAQGVSLNTGLSIGAATLLISAIVLTLWIPLRERPGLGTISNILMIAFAIDLGIHLFPHPQQFRVNLRSDWNRNGGYWLCTLYNLRSWTRTSRRLDDLNSSQNWNPCRSG